MLTSDSPVIDLVALLTEACAAEDLRLPSELLASLAAAAGRDLELRVGTDLTDRLTDEQIEEFEGCIDRQDEAAAHAFLEREIPDFRVIVRDRTAEIVAETAARIVAASAQREGRG